MTRRLVALLAALLAAPASAQNTDSSFQQQLRQVAQTSARKAVSVRPPKDKSPRAEKAVARAVGEYRETIEEGGEVVLEDTLVITRYEPGTVYFKVERQSFENGRHRCELSGVARYEKGRFVFTDGEGPSPITGLSCRLELRLGAEAIELVDDGSCQDYCGVALTLDKVSFKRRGR